MAIRTYEQLRQKTQAGRGFNAPGAAEDLQFLQDIFNRTAATAANDPEKKSSEETSVTPEQYLKALKEQAQEEYEDKFDAHDNLKYCAAKMVAIN